ncbi:hypothetical protein [Mycobacterium sp. E3251]|uniref:hypothetical protein n=1 Tax=Mycobacterium sp. E3251 TaxID=1834144 RepID=UPI0026C01167
MLSRRLLSSRRRVPDRSGPRPSAKRLDVNLRYSTPEEQAWPLICLGSPRLSYVGGEVLWTDGGWNGAMTMGRHRAQWAENPEEALPTKN